MILIDDQLSRDVSKRATFDEALTIIKQLETELANSPVSGIGLAAPQIGIDKAVAIIRIPNVNNDGVLMDPSEPVIKVNLVNPILISAEGLTSFEEGCLSFPTQCAKTIRFEQIVIETDIDDYAFYSKSINNGRYVGGFIKEDVQILNQKRQIQSTVGDTQAEAYTCICIQHEFSHLLGLTMFDFKAKEFGRNDQCPCGSGKKNKKCHDYKHYNENLNRLFAPQYL